jgi:hypothetical protein
LYNDLCQEVCCGYDLAFDVLPAGDRPFDNGILWKVIPTIELKNLREASFSLVAVPLW